MIALLILIDTLLEVYMYIIIANVVMSWLFAFGIMNPHHPFSFQLRRIIDTLCEPVLLRIRRFLPNFGGIDLSPIVVIFTIIFLRNLLARDIAPAVFGY